MDWMGELPFWMHTYPISRIAIPGSHDTGTFSLDPTGPFAPDQPKTLAKILATFACFARPIVYRWSVTQSLDYDAQLASGIRYFDLRISSGPEGDHYYVVHGLFGLDIVECLQAVRSFSDKHPSEVFILDMNHFYDMQTADHNTLIHTIIRELGDLLVPAQRSLESVTLAGLWKTQGRILLIYQKDVAHFFPRFVWCSAAISSPWPNVIDKCRLINYLDLRYDLGPPPTGVLYGTQGILTPSAISIIKRPMSSLRNDMALGATDALLKWIRHKQADNWFNIVLADFTDFHNFTKEIISLNRNKMAPALFSLPLLFRSLGQLPTALDDTLNKEMEGFRKSPRVLCDSDATVPKEQLQTDNSEKNSLLRKLS